MPHINPDAPAFPSRGWVEDGTEYIADAGLTKREYFALQIMSSMCQGAITDRKDAPTSYSIARLAVSRADALIEILDESNTRQEAEEEL